MDKLNDLFNNIKERLTSPFFFSFLLAWMICNWEITIALLWYSKEEVRDAGYENLFDLIRQTETTFWGPVGIAILYTFIYPFVKTGINLFQIWIERIETESGLKISRGASMPMEKYMRLSEEYAQKVKVLREITDRDSENILKAKESENKRIQAEADLQTLQHKSKEQQDLVELQLTKLSHITDSKILDGRWYYQMNDAGTYSKEIPLEIRNSGIETLNDQGEFTKFFNIQHFFYDVHTEKELIFIATPEELIHQQNPTTTKLFVRSPHLTFYFRRDNNGSDFTGTQNTIKTYLRTYPIQPSAQVLTIDGGEIDGGTP